MIGGLLYTGSDLGFRLVGVMGGCGLGLSARWDLAGPLCRCRSEHLFYTGLVGQRNPTAVSQPVPWLADRLYHAATPNMSHD